MDGDEGTGWGGSVSCTYVAQEKQSSIFIPTFAATGGLDADVVELLLLSVSNPVS